MPGLVVCALACAYNPRGARDRRRTRAGLALRQCALLFGLPCRPNLRLKITCRLICLPTHGRAPMAYSSPALIFAAVLAGLLAVVQPAPAEDLYKFKTVTITVGFSPGGGYDVNARALARHLAK